MTWIVYSVSRVAPLLGIKVSQRPSPAFSSTSSGCASGCGWPARWQSGRSGGS